MKNLIFLAVILLTLNLGLQRALAQLEVESVHLDTFIDTVAVPTLELQQTDIYQKQASKLQTGVSEVGQVSQILYDTAQVIGETQQLYEAGKQDVQQVANIMTGLNSHNLPYLIGEVIGLASYGDLLTNNPDSNLQYINSATSLTYDPSYPMNGGFKGGNLGYYDNLIGTRGAPIGFDDNPPVILIPLTRTQAAMLNTSIGQATNSRSFVSDPAFYFNNGPFSDSMMSTITNQLDQIGNGLKQSQICDGCFVRAYAGAQDDMFAAIGQSGIGSEVMAYYANCKNYHPLMGSSTLLGSNMSGGLSGLGSWNNNLFSNIMSAGAFAAVNQYLSGFSAGAAQGTEANPYADMSGYTTQAIITMQHTPIGLPITLTQSQINAANSILNQMAAHSSNITIPIPYVNVNFPKLFSTMPASDANYTPQMVAVITLPSRDAGEYFNKMRGINAQIQSNWEDNQKAYMLLTHLQEVLMGNTIDPSMVSPGLLGMRQNLINAGYGALWGDIKDLGETVGTNSAEIYRATSSLGTDAGNAEAFKGDTQDIKDQLDEIKYKENHVLQGGIDISKMNQTILSQIRDTQDKISAQRAAMAKALTERAELLQKREALRQEFEKKALAQAHNIFMRALNNVPVSVPTSTTNTASAMGGTGTLVAGQ